MGMAASPTGGVALFAVLWIVHRPALPVAAPFLVLWFAGPVVAWWLSLPRKSARADLSQDNRLWLRRLSRKTWRYFETFVGENDHHLPPDNFQEAHTGAVAHRTSPTNIGLYLLSNLAARDFGFQTTRRAADRIERTLLTLQGLERYQGHLLNWYRTDMASPLLPRYVSTVASGNLAGCLIALAHGLREAARTPQTGDCLLDGLADTIRLAEETAAKPLVTSPELRPHLDPLLQELRGLREIVRSSQVPEEKRRLLDSHRARIQECRTAIPLEASTPNDGLKEAISWLQILEEELSLPEPETDDLRERLESLALQAETFANEMDFAFLYDRHRKLMSIGYRLPDTPGPGRLYTTDSALVASEARLASFVGILKGDLPQPHRVALGPQRVDAEGRPTPASPRASTFA